MRTNIIVWLNQNLIHWKSSWNCLNKIYIDFEDVMACLCSYIDYSTWLRLVQFWWNDKRIIVITGEKKDFFLHCSNEMKWNKFLFAMDDLVYEDIQYSIHHLFFVLKNKILDFIIYLSSIQNFTECLFRYCFSFALSRLLNSIHDTLIPTIFSSSKTGGDSLWWNATIYWKFYAQFLCYYLCSKKRQFNIDICSGFTMNIYEIVSAPMITNYIVFGIIFTNYETGRNDFKTIR